LVFTGWAYASPQVLKGFVALLGGIARNRMIRQYIIALNRYEHYATRSGVSNQKRLPLV